MATILLVIYITIGNTQVKTKHYRGIPDLTSGKHPFMRQKNPRDNLNTLRMIQRKIDIFGHMKRILVDT